MPNTGGCSVERAIELIVTERRRQIEAEGWSAEHDDEHDCGELARAAACYAALSEHESPDDIDMPKEWPWGWAWWKPSEDPRKNLVRAGALIVAELERIERAALQSGGQP